MKQPIIFLTLLLITMMNTAHSETQFNTPMYSLEFNIYGTGAEIRFNDIPVYYHDAQGQTSSQKPVPESIIDGENTLTVKSFPLKDNGNQYQTGAYIEAIISVRKKNAPLNNNKPILQLKLNPKNTEKKLLDGTLTKTGDKTAILIKHTDEETIAKRSTLIKSPFPRWAWQDGKSIENNQENYSSLLEKYKEIWEALNNSDLAKTHQLYDPAAQEFAWAYHYQDKQQGHQLMNTGGLIGDDDWKLGSIDKFLSKFNYRLDIFAHGKIAKILDEKNRSPIVYLGRKEKIINIQKFGFYKNKNNEWVMIR